MCDVFPLCSVTMTWMLLLYQFKDSKFYKMKVQCGWSLSNTTDIQLQDEALHSITTLLCCPMKSAEWASADTTTDWINGSARVFWHYAECKWTAVCCVFVCGAESALPPAAAAEGDMIYKDKDSLHASCIVVQRACICVGTSGCLWAYSYKDYYL